MWKKFFGKLRVWQKEMETRDIRIYGIISFLGIIKFVFWLWVGVMALWLILYIFSILFA